METLKGTDPQMPATSETRYFASFRQAHKRQPRQRHFRQHSLISMTKHPNYVGQRNAESMPPVHHLRASEESFQVHCTVVRIPVLQT